ncbi:MAG: extensin family protein, partial [Xanthobacteraceae bacterium]
MKLADGTMVALASPAVPPGIRERIRVAACRYFTTVLGPGADGYHTAHVHLDRIERGGGLRLCQWDVRGPPEVTHVPLPAPKPLKRQSGARRK